MKRIFFTASLITINFVAAFAQNRDSKAENDAAMKAGRIAFATKASKFETEIKSHNYQSAQSLAAEMLSLMRKGMAQTQNEINMLHGDEQNVGFKHYNDLEKTVYEFNKHSQDVTTNGNLLVEDAKTFIKQY